MKDVPQRLLIIPNVNSFFTLKPFKNKNIVKNTNLLFLTKIIKIFKKPQYFYFDVIKNKRIDNLYPKYDSFFYLICYTFVKSYLLFYDHITLNFKCQLL